MKINQESISQTLNLEYSEQVDLFSKSYELINVDFANETDNPNNFKNKSGKCKFCNPFNSVAKFTKKSHTIPQFLGNQSSISDFECDNCNDLFGEYENQFSKFFGHIITINGTKGKRGIPDSASADNKTIAYGRRIADNVSGIAFGHNKTDLKNIKFDPKNKNFSLVTKTEKYIPLSIYKALLKMAVGLMPEKYLEENINVLEFLRDKKHAKFSSKPLIKLVLFSLSKHYERTSILLFKRLEKVKDLPPFLFVLLYEQFMFQILIPNSFDSGESNSQNAVFCPLFPPYLNSSGEVRFDFSVDIINLDSNVQNYRSLEILLKPKINPSNLITVDIETGERKDFSPENIHQFILVKNGTKIPIGKPKI